MTLPRMVQQPGAWEHSLIKAFVLDLPQRGSWRLPWSHVLHVSVCACAWLVVAACVREKRSMCLVLCAGGD